MDHAVRDMPHTEATALARQITANGYAIIDDYVAPDDLRTVQAFVADAVASNDGQYICFTGTEHLRGTFLQRLPTDPSFVDLCRGIYETGRGQTAPDVGFYQILRCLSGSQAQKHSMRFHFDSYVLTALIPIAMPSRGSPARLIIHPNTRGIRRSYLANLVDKVLTDNKLSQILLNAAYRRRSKSMVYLPLKPGSLYFFWGYRSLHTNEPCDADTIRATALLHYADPHADSWLKARLRRQ